MPEDDGFDAMTEACIAAAERVMRGGSPALRAAMRLVLLVLGRDLAQRLRPAGGSVGGAQGAGQARA